MGYDVHITRREDWWDESGPEITEQEWHTVVAADPDLKMTSATTGDDQVPHWIAEMTAHPPEHRLGTAIHWFSPADISAKNPTDILIGKMRAVARSLEARVQGDDGEHYD